MGLAAFRNMDEGDMPNSGCTSPTPSPKPAAPVSRGPPLAPEVDELSLVRTHFLLFKVDLDAPLISRLHGYDRKQRSEFFPYRLTIITIQKHMPVDCIRIHVCHAIDLACFAPSPSSWGTVGLLWGGKRATDLTQISNHWPSFLAEPFSWGVLSRPSLPIWAIQPSNAIHSHGHQLSPYISLGHLFFWAGLRAVLLF